MNNNIVVGNIQKNCFHDGPGIRTTVFLKGCSLRCPWCANPENLTQNIDYICDYDKCDYKNCPYGIQCYGIDSQQEILESNINKCPLNAIRTTGYLIDSNDLSNDILSTNPIDGVTFSGGEPLLQSENLKNVFANLKNKNINICVETSLFVNSNNLINIIDYTDLFFIDLKILTEVDCRTILKGNLDSFLKNIEIVFSKNKDVIFRVPVADNYVYNDSNIKEIVNILKKYRPLKVELFKIHNLASKKYKVLNIEYNDFKPIDDSKINELYDMIKSMNIDVEIIKF